MQLVATFILCLVLLYPDADALPINTSGGRAGISFLEIVESAELYVAHARSTDTWFGLKKLCADKEYTVSAFVEHHVYLVAYPSPKDQAEHGCPMYRFDAQFDPGYETVHKEVTRIEGEAEQTKFKNSHVMGSRKLSEIMQAFEDVRIASDEKKFNIIEHNCAALVLKTLSQLRFPLDQPLADYTSSMILKSDVLVENIRTSPQIPQIFGDQDRAAAEARTDEDLIRRLVHNYIVKYTALAGKSAGKTTSAGAAKHGIKPALQQTF